MSLATWKAQFYPVPASEPKTALEAVDHSILKWDGMQHKALTEHEVRHSPVCQSLVDQEGFTFWPGSGTCALCVKFCKEDTEDDESPCNQCPLAIVRAQYDEDGCLRPVACDSERRDEKFTPWEHKTDKPEVMLMWLRKAREYVIDHPEQF